MQNQCGPTASTQVRSGLLDASLWSTTSSEEQAEERFLVLSLELPLAVLVSSVYMPSHLCCVNEEGDGLWNASPAACECRFQSQEPLTGVLTPRRMYSTW